MNNSFKKAVVTGLTLAMVMGGSTAAFADSNKGKGNDKGKGHGIEWKKAFQSNNKNKDDKDAFINNLNVNNLIVKLTFDDVKGGDVEWAARFIASLASKGVFEGYEDGTFQPRRTISRIDAIAAAVRLMGLREEAESAEAKQTNLNFKDANKVKDWAKGYVAVALENDLFEESDDMVQPEKEADRLWATTLLVKALKKQDEAKAKMDTKLNFRDADKIPAGSVGYVAVAIEQGLIDGYEDNTFRPNKPVTRAEMAKLLDRTGVNMPNDAEYNFRGTLYADVSNNTLFVTEDGNNYSIQLSSDVQIYRDGVRVSASALKSGDSVRVGIAGNQAISVDATSNGSNSQLPQNATFAATLNSEVSNNKISLIKDNVTINNVEFLWNATIERDGTTVLASSLRVGDQVSVTTENGKIKRIVVTNAVESQLPQNATFAATVNSVVSNSKISLIQDDRTYNNVEFLWNATIERDGATVPASSLRVGDQVSVTTENGKIKRIIVTNAVESQLPQNSTFTATVNSEVSNGKLSLTLDGRIYNNVEFLWNAIIRRDNVTIPATSLRAGDEVRVTTENGKIKEVVVTRNTYSINARFNSVDTYANGEIYRISVDKFLDNGTVQDNVYFDTITNVVFEGGSRSDLTVDRAIELRVNGSDNKVNTIVIK